jgi:phospholipid/cholesterol/gamma-HCH transport system permease protein
VDERPNRVGDSLLAGPAALGQLVNDALEDIGCGFHMLVQSIVWISRSLIQRKVRLGRVAIVSQIVRVGVQAVGIIALVAGCVGFILGLQMAPPLDQLGQKELVPNIIGVAMLRELGPLIAGIVMTGYAGAAIAAELGTMVVGEEIEALEAHALNPIRFLVVPRLIAVVISMTMLAVVSDFIGIVAGLGMGVWVLEIPADTYIGNTVRQVDNTDFLTGLTKGAVFGLLIGLIACSNGLRVSGGAAGVGRATTQTVVRSVVAIICADLLFTGLFYALDWV